MPLPADAVALDQAPGKLPDDAIALPQADKRGPQFNPQVTKALYEHIPFGIGKKVIQTVDKLAGTKMQQEVESTPKAEGFFGKAGELVGEALSFAPAFEAGAGLAAPAKMLGASTGVGVQSGLEKANQPGATGKEALLTGAESAAGTYVGGKVLEGAGKLISDIPGSLRGTAGRIHDYMVKVPTKGFSYGKDPLEVMAKEKIEANTMHDYAAAAEDRLTQRTQELNEAVKGSDAKVNLENAVDQHIKSAQIKAEVSLQDRTELNNKLAEIRGRISTQYGNLDNLSIADAVKLKRQLAEDFPFAPMEAKSSTNNLLSRAAHQIHHSINDAIDVAAPKVAELNDRVSSLIDISKAAQNRVAIESRNHPLGLIGSIVGVGAGATAGAMTGHNPLEAGLLTAAVLKAGSSPAVLTRVANALSRMSEVDKINLFKASPEFMNLAQKAHEYVKSAGSSLGLAGKVGSKAEPVEAELMGGRQIEYQKPMVRSDRALPAPEDAGQSSGPVIKQGPPEPTTDDPSGFLKESRQRMGGTQIGNESGSVNIGGGKYKSFVTKNGGDDIKAIYGMKSGPSKLELYHASARQGETRAKDMWFDLNEGGFGEDIHMHSDDSSFGKYHVDSKKMLAVNDTEHAALKLFGNDESKYPRSIKDLMNGNESFDPDSDGMRVDRALTKKARELGYDSILFKDRGHGGSEFVLLNPKQAKLIALRNDDLSWKNVNNSEKGIVSIGEDLRGKSKEELQESLKHYQDVYNWSKGSPDKSNLQSASIMVNKIKNALADVGKSPMGLTAAAGVGTAAALRAKNKVNDEDAIKTIIGEGESTGFQGMRALASAIRNRGTLQGAYGLNSPRVTNKLYSPKTERLARQAWEDSKKKDWSEGANHWFSDADLKTAKVQKMIKSMKKLGSYRGNNFYQEKGKSK